MPLAPVTKTPFGLQIPSEDAVPHHTWRRACKEAFAALEQGKSVAVLGRPGTGKTFLLQHLARTLQSKGSRVHSFGAPDISGVQLPNDVLLVDEADRLPDATIDMLCDRDGLFILAGLPENAARLAGCACPIVFVTLEPLSPEDVARFVAARLSTTGYKRDLLEADAVLALAQHSAGLLRLVIVLAGSALFLAEHEGADRVSKRHVDEAAAMRELGSDELTTKPHLPQPSWHTPQSTVVPTLAHPEPELHAASPLRVNRVAFGLGGLLLLVALGWELLSRHYPSRPPSPQREAALALPSVSAPMPATIPASPPVAELPSTTLAPVPAGSPASIVVPETGPAPTSQSSARIVPPTQPRQVESTTAFQGSVLNETMNQKGHLLLGVRRQGSNSVTISFHASAGLIGSGDLTGTITAAGQIMASGRLMMGRNPFDTTLTATIVGDRLEGAATFVRSETGNATRSRFSLTRF